MKIHFISVLFCFAQLSSSFILESKLFKCPLLLPNLNHNSHTLIIDMETNANDTSVDIWNCLIDQVTQYKQTITLLKGFDIEEIPIHDKVTNDPNVIIVSKKLRPYLFETAPFNIFLRSHWSLCFFVILDNSEYTCENGNMTKSDFQMLETIMNVLWHRRKIVHVAATFPFACKDKLVYYSGKRPSKHYKTFDRTITLEDIKTFIETPKVSTKAYDLTAQYPIKGNLFFRYPTAITDCDDLHYYNKVNMNLTGGYCGMDALVMQDIIKYFEFKIDFINDTQCNQYGYAVGENKTGSLGCVIQGNVDISFNSRFMTMYSNDAVTFLYYVRTDSLCPLIKAAGFKPIWSCVYDVYSYLQWFMLISTILVVGIVTWFAQKVTVKIATDGEFKTVYYYIVDVASSTMFGVSLSRKSSLCKGTCLVSSILFSAIYQSHINYAYTTEIRKENMNSLEAVFKSRLTLYTTPSIYELMKKQSTHDIFQRDFLERAHIMSVTQSGSRLAFLLETPDSVTIGRKSDDTMEILGLYMNPHGKPQIHIIDECFGTYYLTYMVRTDFPFVEYVQIFLDRMTEAGLPDAYYRWTRFMLDLPDSFPPDHNSPRAFAKISLEDQRVAFSLLFLGYIGSIAIFVVERWKGERHAKGHLRKNARKRVVRINPKVTYLR